MELRDIKITLATQEGKLGRPFRNSSVSRVNDNKKWINNAYRWQWLYVFIYVDDIGGGFSFIEDYYGNRINLTKIQ